MYQANGKLQREDSNFTVGIKKKKENSLEKFCGQK